MLYLKQILYWECNGFSCGNVSFPVSKPKPYHLMSLCHCVLSKMTKVPSSSYFPDLNENTGKGNVCINSPTLRGSSVLCGLNYALRIKWINSHPHDIRTTFDLIRVCFFPLLLMHAMHILATRGTHVHIFTCSVSSSIVYGNTLWAFLFCCWLGILRKRCVLL